MSILLNTINDFNQNGIKYTVFKEFDLIEKSLEGKEDIDILISEEDIKNAGIIIRKNGYRKCKWPKPMLGISFYLGYDVEHDCMSLLHIHTRMRIGTKAYKELRWKELETYILRNYNDSNKYHCKTICESEEICLLFIRMILRKKPNKDDYSRMRELNDHIDINCVAFSPVVHEMIKKNSIYMEKYLSAESFGSDSERASIRTKLKKEDRISVFIRVLWGVVHRSCMFLRRSLKLPYRPIRNIGKIFAIVGVDGCGKSTMLDLLLNNDVMKLIGIKRIYGGNNEYWMPGLQRIVDKSKKRYKTIGFLRILDKRLRIVIALFYTLIGFNVVFDRYYYDDMVSYSVQHKSMSSINKVKNKLLNHIGIVPYHTFFLDIDAENAYKRKQDYEYNTLEKNVNAYRRIVGNRKETVIIDSMNDVKENESIIIQHIFQ